MNEGAWMQLVLLTGWLILAASAFASYRMSWGQTIRMALLWAAIFTGAALVFDMIL